MTLTDIALVLAGALAGGFVNGLTGFGTGLSALPLWLIVLPPVQAAQLASAASVVGQLRMLPAVWPSIAWRRVAPFILPGLAGVPIGVALAPLIPVPAFKLGIGVILLVYAAVMLAAGTRLRVPGGGVLADAAVGLGGGVLGGVAGLSGVLPTMWAAAKSYTKEQKRALFQSFNLTILAAMLIASALAGQMTLELGRLLAIALPGTLAGNALGQWTFRRLSDRTFDRLVLALLMAAGLSLVLTNVGSLGFR